MFQYHHTSKAQLVSECETQNIFEKIGLHLLFQTSMFLVEVHKSNKWKSLNAHQVILRF